MIGTLIKTMANQTLYVGNGDSLPRLFLDSTSSGGTWTAQGAHISLGETAGENASLSLTYTGDGYGRIGMGDITSGVPDNGEIRFTYYRNISSHHPRRHLVRAPPDQMRSNVVDSVGFSRRISETLL